MQTSPISKNTHNDVIKRGMPRDTKNHSHVIKQVNNNKSFYTQKIAPDSILCGGRLIIKSQALTHLSSDGYLRFIAEV